LTAILVLLAGVPGRSFPLLGGQFLPKLEEGNVWATATMPLTISRLRKGAKLSNRNAQRWFTSFPESSDGWSRSSGAPDSGTETTGFFSHRIQRGPQNRKKQWPAGHEQRAAAGRKSISDSTGSFPQSIFDYSQNIESQCE